MFPPISKIKQGAKGLAETAALRRKKDTPRRGGMPEIQYSTFSGKRKE